MRKLAKQQPIDESQLLINNLKGLMTAAHINEAELARQTGLPQPTLHKILAGKTSDPRYSTLVLLADFFAVSVDALYNENGVDYKNPGRQTFAKTISIPILSWSECLNPEELLNKNQSHWNLWVNIESEAGNLYALISKPCCEPRFPKGSVLIINPNLPPQDGDFIIAKYPNTTEACLRELSIDGPNRLLLPLNGNYAVEKQANNIKIIGVLVQSRFIHRD